MRPSFTQFCGCAQPIRHFIKNFCLKNTITNKTLCWAIMPYFQYFLYLCFTLIIIALFKPQHDKINKMTCVPSEDSDQPGRMIFLAVYGTTLTITLENACVSYIFSNVLRYIVWTLKFSGCLNDRHKLSRKRLCMKSGSKKEFCNIVILYIIRKFGILLLYIYEGKCIS